MSSQVLNQFRCDKTLREDCVAIYEALGMDLNTAFRMFMERTRLVRGLPFPAVLPETKMTRVEAQKAIDDLRAEASELPEMTLDEINAEIQAARAERKARKHDADRIDRDRRIAFSSGYILAPTKRGRRISSCVV